MTDESFHLTPVEVRRWDFGQKFRGCDPVQVENFRNRVAEELERLTRVNQELESKAKGFHEQLRAFRERDKALNEALVSAQQLRGEIRDQADREGQVVVREARVEADKALDEARAEARNLLESARGESRRLLEEATSQMRTLQIEVQHLEKSRRTFAAQLRSMIERQLHELNAIEASTDFSASLGAQSPGSSSRAAAAAPTPATRAAAPSSNGADTAPAPQPSAPAVTARPTPVSAIPNLPIPDVGMDHGDGRVDQAPLKTPAWLESFSPGAPKE